MSVNELVTKRAKLWESAKSFLDSRGDILTAEDEASYQKMEKEILDLGMAIDRAKRRDEMDALLAAPVAAPIMAKPAPMDNYKARFMAAVRTGFRNAAGILTEGADSEGGYLVPEEMDATLVEKLAENNVLRQLGNVITTSGLHKINVAGTQPEAAWIDEGGAISFANMSFGQVPLDAHKLHVAIKVTEELLHDNAFNLEGYIMTQFARALAEKEEDAFLNGDGSKKPTGIFTSGAANTTTAGASLAADDILQLVYALKRPYRARAAFIMNDKTLLSLRKLKDSNGQYVWQPSYQAGEPDRILSYPVYTSGFAPEASAGKGFIAFGDYSYYAIGDRGQRSFTRLDELFAANGMIGFVMKERVDGKLTLSEAVQVLKLKGQG